MQLQKTTHQIIQEVDQVLDRVEVSDVKILCDEILKANQIFLYSMGREGLVMRSFAMRLMHLGLKVFFVGDMTTPPIGKDDLLILSCGPGSSNTLQGLTEISHKAGGHMAIITAQPEGRLSTISDFLLYLPAQTMAEKEKSKSIQPMGSVFEQAEWILLDAIIIFLQKETGQTFDNLRQRHTNLE